jgi:hypothetical protein
MPLQTVGPASVTLCTARFRRTACSLMTVRAASTPRAAPIFLGHRGVVLPAHLALRHVKASSPSPQCSTDPDRSCLRYQRPARRQGRRLLSFLQNGDKRLDL